MLLAVDAGNSETVVGLFELDGERRLLDTWRLSTQADRTSDEVALLVQEFLGFHGFNFDTDIAGVVVASNVPRITTAFREMTERYFGFPAVVLQPVSFEQMYLSYHGHIPASEFFSPFPPDGRFLYQRGAQPVPERMIRAYQVRLNGEPGPWLAGMTLDPVIVYEAWCHERGYVCFIQEIGGIPVKTGEGFSAAYLVGWFDSVTEMERAYDAHRGASLVAVSEGRYTVE